MLFFQAALQAEADSYTGAPYFSAMASARLGRNCPSPLLYKATDT